VQYDRDAVKSVLATVQKEGRTSLTAPEARKVCEAYGIPLPHEAMASSSADAGKLATEIGFPVVIKIASPGILHKTDAGGVTIGISGTANATQAYDTIVANAKAYKADARIIGVQIQQMIPHGGTEVVIGAVSDPSFGKLVAFGLGGVLVEIMKDITFRLAPASEADAASMLDGISGAAMLRGVRGAPAADRGALTRIIRAVSQLVSDFRATFVPCKPSAIHVRGSS
jgi:acyl-CoA synthetase (NDP forming)